MSKKQKKKGEENKQEKQRIVRVQVVPTSHALLPSCLGKSKVSEHRSKSRKRCPFLFSVVIHAIYFQNLTLPHSPLHNCLPNHRSRAKRPFDHLIQTKCVNTIQHYDLSPKKDKTTCTIAAYMGTPLVPTD